MEILPNDEEHREGFDNGVDFRIGDPNVHFRAAAAKSYETTQDIGKPELGPFVWFHLGQDESAVRSLWLKPLAQAVRLKSARAYRRLVALAG